VVSQPEERFWFRQDDDEEEEEGNDLDECAMTCLTGNEDDEGVEDEEGLRKCLATDCSMADE